MKSSSKGLLAVLGLVLGAGFSPVSFSTVFYQDDFEGGIKYVGSANKHPGGGYISFLGGEVNNGVRPGNGMQDYLRYTNVVLDSAADAVGSISGSRNALKTFYRAGYEDNFQLNTTVIVFPETPTVYIRWYQKWSKDWIWPNDQQKLAKVKGPEQSQNFKLTWGNDYISVTKKSPPPNDNLNETYVFSDSGADRVTDWLRGDSDATTKNFPLAKNRWYCVEVMVKSNTPGKSDGRLSYWIDDSMKFDLNNTINRGSSTRGIDSVELQHVLQTGGAHNPIDTPTWMDNIAISDQRIGCAGASPAPAAAPMAPAGFGIEKITQ